MAGIPVVSRALLALSRHEFTTAAAFEEEKEGIGDKFLTTETQESHLYRKKNNVFTFIRVPANSFT